MKNRRNLILLLLAVAMSVLANSKLSVADQDWLSTYSGYIEGLASSNGEPIIFDGWQREEVDSDDPFVIMNKGRQIGSSFGPIAAKAVAKSQLIPRKLSVFTSMNLDDAREKILYAREIHDSIPHGFKSKLTTDNKFQLGFANGSRIITLFIPRGKGPADVYIDEMAFMRRDKDVYNGALYMTLRGGNVFIGSTPFGHGLFYDIYTDHKQYKDYRRRTVPWWLSPQMCIDVSRAMIEAPNMQTHERVAKFGNEVVKRIFDNTTLESFQQEMECMFIDDQLAFLPFDLIKDCVDESDDYLYYANRDGQKIELADFEQMLKGIKKNLKGIPYGGYDVGRRRHPAVLEIAEKIHNKYYLRMCISFYKMPFPDQEEFIRTAIKALPMPKFGIDETGNGMQLAENLFAEYPGIVVPINYSSRVDARMKEPTEREKKKKIRKKSTLGVKERMATDLKIEMQKHNMVIPPDKSLMLQLNSIKAETSISGNVTYSVDKNETHHADKVWALAEIILVSQAPTRSAVSLVTPVFVKARA